LAALKKLCVPERLKRLVYYPECEALAENFQVDGITAEYLTALSYLLDNLAPHISLLTKLSFKNLPNELFDVSDVEKTWSSCPFPLRVFVFEQGFLKNSTRGEKDPLRLGFLWSVIAHNQSKNNISALLQVVGLFLEHNRSSTEKTGLLSHLRVIPSRNHGEELLKNLNRNREEVKPPYLLTFSFDNHQQAASMRGNAKNLHRPTMVNSITRCMKILPSLPEEVLGSSEGRSLKKYHFFATEVEKQHLKEAYLQFFQYAATSLLDKTNSGTTVQSALPIEKMKEFVSEDDSRRNGDQTEQDEDDEEEEDPSPEKQQGVGEKEGGGEEEDTQEPESGEPFHSSFVDPEYQVEELVHRNLREEGEEGKENQMKYPPIYVLEKLPEQLKLVDLSSLDDKINCSLKLDGKSKIKILPQLLGNSEDPENILQVLKDFIHELDIAEQPRAFLMCDEKLFTLTQKLYRDSPELGRFRFVLDPFHAGWNMDKVNFPYFEMAKMKRKKGKTFITE